MIGYKVSFIRDDFPLPETPVTPIILFNGMERLTFFRLLPVHPVNVIFLEFPFLLLLGLTICLILFK